MEEIDKYKRLLDEMQKKIDDFESASKENSSENVSLREKLNFTEEKLKSAQEAKENVKSEVVFIHIFC